MATPAELISTLKPVQSTGKSDAKVAVAGVSFGSNMSGAVVPLPVHGLGTDIPLLPPLPLPPPVELVVNFQIVIS